MDVLVLVEICEFLVWRLVGERQTATAAACFAGLRANLVALTAVATADRGDVVNQVLIVCHIKCSLPGRIVPRILTDERRIRLLVLEMPDAGENHREAVLVGGGDR